MTTNDVTPHFNSTRTIVSVNTDSWVLPDGPWGWHDDGTSRAPTPALRRLHVEWYHDNRDWDEDQE